MRVRVRSERVFLQPSVRLWMRLDSTEVEEHTALRLLTVDSATFYGHLAPTYSFQPREALNACALDHDSHFEVDESRDEADSFMRTWLISFRSSSSRSQLGLAEVQCSCRCSPSSVCLFRMCIAFSCAHFEHVIRHDARLFIT